MSAISWALQNPNLAGYILGAAFLGLIALWFIRRWLHERWLATHTDLNTILQLSPRAFEFFCRDLMAREGYRVHLTRATNDQGVDLELDGRDGRGVAQVKRWTNKPVGRPHLQQLYGEMTHRRSRYAFFITTSWFTRDGEVWARGKGFTLIDGRDLERLASKHFGRFTLETREASPLSPSFAEDALENERP